MEEQVTTRPRGRPPKSNVQAPEFLGTFNIAEGLPEDAFDAVSHGIPNAMSEAPSHQRKTRLDMATPKPRPGYAQRWVRVFDVTANKPDVANKAEAMQMGWRPRRVESMADVDGTYPIYDAGDGRGGIYVFKEELVLFEIPIERLKYLEGVHNAEADLIGKAIAEKTRTSSGIPSKYGSVAFDGVGADALMD